MPARPRRRVGSRPHLAELEKRRVWVRSGGRCAICNRDLLDGSLTDEPVSLGELAHIVGQQQTPGSPRGMAPYDKSLRDLADNILLACGDCHAEIDNPQTLDLFTVEALRETKRIHEERIKHVTGLGMDQRTLVLRVIGQLRGRPLELAKRTAVGAVIASGERYPFFGLSYDRIGVEVDLRRLPGESPRVAGDDIAQPAPTKQYYDSARAMIDDVIDNILNDGLARDEVHHVSVFAWARLPLLVYLGRKLGDGYTVDLYQRQQSTDSWAWSQSSEPAQFVHSTPDESDGDDGVLLASVSGTVHEDEVPEHLKGRPIFHIRVVNRTATGGVIDSKATLENFRLSLRDFFGELELKHKNISRLHLFGALPISAAIALGRVREPTVQPSIVTYDLVDRQSYQLAFEIP